MVGAPVWPNGVTVSARAALAVTAVAAIAAAPFINRRRLSRGLPGKVSGLVMIASLEFFVGEEILCSQSGIKQADCRKQPQIDRIYPLRLFCDRVRWVSFPRLANSALRLQPKSR